MDTFEELIALVQNELVINDTSTLFPLSQVKLAINKAYVKAGGLFPWPELEDAKKTSTKSGYYYYDMPQNWYPDSIWRLEIDGVRYGLPPDGSPLVYKDFIEWREDNPNSTDKRWASQWKRFFIHPASTTNGNNNISIWGIRSVDLLSASDDVTIWSYSNRECNIAVVNEAIAMLKAKGEDVNASGFYSVESKNTLARTWQRIRDNQSKFEKIQPMYEVPDYLHVGGGSSQNIGNFDVTEK